MDKYVRQGGTLDEGLETFLTSPAAENILRSLARQDFGGFEDLVSGCLKGAVRGVVSDDSLQEAFARLTVRHFLRFEKRHFLRTTLR